MADGALVAAPSRPADPPGIPVPASGGGATAPPGVIPLSAGTAGAGAAGAAGAAGTTGAAGAWPPELELEFGATAVVVAGDCGELVGPALDVGVDTGTSWVGIGLAETVTVATGTGTTAVETVDVATASATAETASAAATAPPAINVRLMPRNLTDPGDIPQ